MIRYGTGEGDTRGTKSRRPVWLFSLDCERFVQPPLVTGGLKSYFLRHGRTALATDVDLVHFTDIKAVARWFDGDWRTTEEARARRSLVSGQSPVAGFSCYMWNTEAFLALIEHLKARCPELLVVVGGPDVQRPDRLLIRHPIDAAVLGEGEATFTDLLDCSPEAWPTISGVAHAERNGDPAPRVVRTSARPRTAELDSLPSALDVVALRDDSNQALYRRAAYETVRGCPFRCAFCEWGTAATGQRMYEYSLDRIRSDLERLVAGGVEELYISDSNFGSIPDDLRKAELLVELRQRTGLPRIVSINWTKNHRHPRVLEIVRMLHKHGLLKHFTLAIQTLTPHALQLSNRTNMPLNDYRGIAKAMATEGVPVRTELIWGLPGDTLADFKGNLDELLGVFPDVAIYAYALLAGTEFFDRREKYRIRTERVHPVADVAADYVVSTLSCSRSETLEGYVLLSAHSVLNEGRVIPLTSRYLALRRELSPSDLLLTVIRALVEAFPEATDGATAEDDMAIFECRFQILRLLLDHREETFGVIRNAVASHFDKLTKSSTCAERVTKVIDLDEALCAPLGAWEKRRVPFTFHAHGVQQLLAVMQVPHDELFEQASDVLECTFLPWGRAGAMVRLVV